MKFVTFQTADHPTARPGVLLAEAAAEVIADLSGLFPDTLSIIAGAEPAQATIEAGLATCPRLPLADATLLAPISNPPRIFAIGLNYAEHATESKMKTQAVPTVFLKLQSGIVGQDATVILPKNSTEPDYEVEMAVVIGKGGYRIAAADWEQHVFGYTICNDISARDIQLATTQWTLGKSFPTFCPLGPAIVTADEVGDPHTLDISLAIDGEVLQSANTRDLIFKVPALIEYLSSICPLEPGDIISTGTPQGVGLGRDPKRWIKPNEEMVLRVEKLGELRNKTVAER
ncbi:2-keto-4-pentenoate hydratase/2-oxohepta-3-ene-1,7-dioic acid hydratase (catechol pathway) [Bryocella elongata]|uniref:2-keto-4-pentenoate hydratase/2-oxohepta-3-ene-1,7-dioic acid hydratase (Catechol pathway) n=1 Tax=Bryocella elongata TaxID=863522 RepID=A0A1H6B3T6_9BACT|nr:fumarylacetoacetate hydrolase family protein [Bryocella elongata]SEG55262.1 2-keto-4-pentenoate hydratase/2-oxohepta-3-ene-1,7-dioic acid hydratase (catechol pathway) [Bryocella elongata]